MLTLTPRPSQSNGTRPPGASPRPAPRAITGALEMIGAPMSYARNEEICGQGEEAEFLYKVVSGAVRAYQVLDDGRRQISAFHLPGDFFGLESGEHHGSSAEAIGDATVLVFKRSAVLALAGRDSEVGRQLWQLTALELHRAQDHALLLIKSAKERVVSFLLDTANRMAGASKVELPMSRQDIADYLGLTIETVSRMFSQLESVGAIALPTSRQIELRDRAALKHLNTM